MDSLFAGEAYRPLADRVRPDSLSDFIGQADITGPGQFLRTVIEKQQPVSMILWGPPGTGKTTLARIIANSSDCAFDEVSAVTTGIAEVKKLIEAAKERQRLGQKTILFVDEIHRFNKAQQDAFLPHVEAGTIILIGATTENPSFEVIGPLLSRSRVVVLKNLTDIQIGEIIDRAAVEFKDKKLTTEARDLLAKLSAGDARVALNGLEAAAGLVDKTIDSETIKQAMQKVGLKYDKKGDWHYDWISAFIKSMRGSDVDASLFYLARMIESGEDPKFIARRMVIFASEDIGMADPRALEQATAVFLAVERIGYPECQLNLAQGAIYLAQAAKSRSVASAIGKASQTVRDNPTAQVPLHLRNAPTKLMKNLGYNKDYEWKANFQHEKGFLPSELAKDVFIYRKDQKD